MLSPWSAGVRFVTTWQALWMAREAGRSPARAGQGSWLPGQGQCYDRHLASRQAHRPQHVALQDHRIGVKDNTGRRNGRRSAFRPGRPTPAMAPPKARRRAQATRTGA